MMVVDGVHLEVNRSKIDAVVEEFMAKVALITGANKGIGFEVARQLGRAGLTVLLGARDKSRGEVAADKLRGEGYDVRFVVADLNSAPESGAALAKQIGEE